MSLLRKAYPGAGLGILCGLFGYSRQAYYKRDDEDDFAREAMVQIIVYKAAAYRQDNPRLGGVKLFHMIRSSVGEGTVFPGRDAFLGILRQHGLILKLRHRGRIYTTDSSHGYRKYPNLIKGLAVYAPNRVWVSDITYIEMREGVCYLSLVTDLYSRKILGWSVGPTLETTYCLQALDKALGTLGDEIPQGLIHHSDRGSQYCSHAYVGKLKSKGIAISMSQGGNPLENAVVERVNGILKMEWLNHQPPKDIDECRETVERIVGFYNGERPHMSLGYKTPNQVHSGQGRQERCWRNPWEPSGPEEGAVSGTGTRDNPG